VLRAGRVDRNNLGQASQHFSRILLPLLFVITDLLMIAIYFGLVTRKAARPKEQSHGRKESIAAAFTENRRARTGRDGFRFRRPDRRRSCRRHPQKASKAKNHHPARPLLGFASSARYGNAPLYLGIVRNWAVFSLPLGSPASFRAIL